MALGVIAVGMIWDMGMTLMRGKVEYTWTMGTLMEMGIGGVIGVAVGIFLFFYVAGLVYGMSTLNGRKTLMGLGLLTLLIGIGSFSYPIEVGAILPLHLLVGLFVTPEEGAVVEYSVWYGIPYVINGGLMCKLGSFKE